VSSQHALVRYNGVAWEIRDLGSRNGTWLNGVALAPSASIPLRVGARLRFGDDAEEWILEDASEPVVIGTDVFVLESGRIRSVLGFLDKVPG
jgi:pSer/pThr/pTyr-binding forkhead associated (FHA) protein